jgi:hypothetical protein
MLATSEGQPPTLHHKQLDHPWAKSLCPGLNPPLPRPQPTPRGADIVWILERQKLVYRTVNTSMWLVHSNMTSRANNEWNLYRHGQGYSLIQQHDQQQFHPHLVPTLLIWFVVKISISSTWSYISRVIGNHSTSTECLINKAPLTTSIYY